MDGNKLTDEEKSKIIALIQQGEDTPTIAKHMGKPYRDVENFRKDYVWMKLKWRFPICRKEQAKIKNRKEEQK